jgi:hypothetical protein
VSEYAYNESERYSRIVWSNDATRNARNAAYEYDSSPTSVFHCRETEFGEKICGAAIDTPRLLKGINIDLVDEDAA